MEINKIMIYLKGIYDPSSNRMMIEYTSGLLPEYFGVLQECFKTYLRKLPSGAELKDLGEGKCLITFRINLPDTSKVKQTLPNDVAEIITDLLNDFKNKAMRVELGKTEFIPLSGYPIEDLKKDIIGAIDNHRDFLLIDKYSEYLRFSKGETNNLKQKKIKYLTSEYSDIAIYIHEGKLKKIKDLYMETLEEKSWD